MLAEQFGIPPAAVHFIDGSGNEETTATAEAVTTLLATMRQRPSHTAFRDSLPTLGVDGSLAIATDFAADPTLAGARGDVRAKTGTYVGVITCIEDVLPVIQDASRSTHERHGRNARRTDGGRVRDASHNLLVRRTVE